MRVLIQSPQILSQLLGKLAVGAVLLVSTTVFIAVLWLSHEFDDDARESSYLMIDSGLNGVVRRNEIIGRDYAYWTEAFNAVAANDIEWLDVNLGSGVLADTMHVLVLAGGPLPETLGWADNESSHLDSTDFAAFRNAGFDLVTRNAHNPGDSAISAFVDIDDTLWTIAVDWIVPHDRILDENEPKALLVSAVRLDDQKAAQWSKMFLLEGLGFVENAEDIGGREAIAINGAAGTLRYLVWSAPRPGMEALHAVAVPLILALILVTVAIGLGALAVSRLAKRLERALIAAEVADRTKSEFIATLSHELRTPMNGIVGILELLQIDQLSAEQRELVALGLNSAENQLELIDHLLAFGQIDSGNRQISTGPFIPGETIREVVALAMPLAVSKELGLSFVHKGPIHTTLLGDHLAIRQIAVNLLNNAIKFTDQGRVSVHLEVAQSFNGNRLRLAVTDTGPGIAAEHIEGIFESFVQVDGSATRGESGVGLGLAISQRLATAMGGTLTVDSMPRQGATFVFDVLLETRVTASDILENAA